MLVEGLVPKFSYGRFVTDKNRHCQESFGKARAKFQEGITHANSDLREYYRNPKDEAVETLDSCGKGCEFVVLAKDEVTAEEFDEVFG